MPGPGLLFLNSKNLTDLRGLNSAAPVPACFDTVYFPEGERASGSSYFPGPGLMFWLSIVNFLSNILVRSLNVYLCPLSVLRF